MYENSKNLKNQHFNLVGNYYNLAQIEEWYKEEEIYHDKFKGRRSDKYWKIYEIFDNKYTFEVGGKNKTTKQIAGIEKAFIVSDDIDYGFQNKIPLWIFGFLY